MQAGSESASRLPSSTPAGQGFAPLPLRARGTLEILDTAIKVYKQYFWVLIGWAAIVAAGGSVPYISSLTWIFLWPLIIGACVCCITAAVRGQQVTFSQCWNFTQPRFGALIGTMFFALLIFIAVLIAVVVAAVFAGIASAPVLSQLPVGLQVFLWFLLFLLCVAVVSVSTVWLNIALVVICMEEGMHSARAMGRSFDLLRGYWLRVSTLIALLSLAMLALMGALYGAGALFMGISNIPAMLSGQNFESLATLMIVMTLVSALVGTIWYPVFYLTLALFYIDMRIRKEALDIEWSAHLSAQDSLPAKPELRPEGAWSPDTDVSLRQGQPSFRAALSGVAGGLPGGGPGAVASGAATPVHPEQQAAWPGSPNAASPAPPPRADVTPGDQAAWFGAAPAAAAIGAAPAVWESPQTHAPGESAPAGGPPAADAQAADAQAADAPAADRPAGRVLCSQCGHGAPAGQAFCMNCGARLQASGDAPPSGAQW